MPPTTDPHLGSTLVGGRLLDAADPATWNAADPRDSCPVCGTTDAQQLVRTLLDPADLMRHGGIHGTGTACTTHLEAALRRLGPPTPHTQYCSARPCGQLYAQTWPLRPVLASTEPTIRACRRHLAEQIATLAQLTTTQETPNP